MTRKVSEASIALFVFCVAIALAGAFAIVSTMSDHPTQTASATTDYFSWSCQQLQTAVDANLEQFSFWGNNSDSYQVQTGKNAFADGLIGIMQLKGCSVSP